MFFKTGTVYKCYNTRKSAEAYIARNFANRTDIAVQEAGGNFYVVGA